MDPSRAEGIAGVIQNIKGLGKSIKKPSTLKLVMPGEGARLAQPVEGSIWLRVLMYACVGLLVLALILLIVDQWITPIFQRTYGDSGYIPVPGVDPTDQFWITPLNVRDVSIGTPTPLTATQIASGVPKTLSTNLIEGQANWSLTMDVLIKDEQPQNLGSGNTRRIFFVGGTTLTSPFLTAWLDNSTNTLHVTMYDGDSSEQSVSIDNVPIHTPFRLGIVKTASTLEGYLNGLLVMTRQLKTATKIPRAGDKLFSTSNIKNGENTLSTGIKVLNLRVFGYTAESSEIKGRMFDLTDISVFNTLNA